MKYGWKPSRLDGTELDLDQVYKDSKGLPKEFDYSKTVRPLKTVKNQGETSMCVCYSLGYALETLEYLSRPEEKFILDYDEIYSIREDKGTEGMEIKEALVYVKGTGYKFGQEIHKIRDFGKLTSRVAIQRSLFLNGPCLMALPVYDGGKEWNFWNGSEICGGHAVCCIGWTEEGFILENSWGSGWGKSGKTLLPYSDLKKLYEAWGILK